MVDSGRHRYLEVKRRYGKIKQKQAYILGNEVKL
jgi:hypothetical protein